MSICGACRRESPPEFAFCPGCGNPLAGTTPVQTERKIVSILFCDLVGFTARSDRADPEDVRALLQPFHAMARTEIERFGGTLDKFIGDAAMGVFGSPISHEDDPERAVRAALAILDGVGRAGRTGPARPLDVRIAVNTGEAVVTLAGGTQEGERVAGDVVNTASRLQSVAPVGSAIVGEATYRRTREAFDYEAMEPVAVKGKAEPLAAWRAVAARRAIGAVVERTTEAPFVGRASERLVIQEAFHRAARESSVQVVTIVGEPGVGKSRLVAEVRAGLAADGVSPQWLRGRCLPYGEGVTFWAIAEIVKARSGILESDDHEQRVAKLRAALEGLESDPTEEAWLRVRLAPLVGAEAGPPAEREESFTAWRRFLEAVARTEPLVAVFEDIHWADPAMLSFLEHLIDQAEPVPLLVIATARPELYDRHPGWGGGMRNAAVLSLAPLSSDQTTELVTNLLWGMSLAPEARAVLLERSGGNPLYAEEFVRMLKERRLLDEGGVLLPGEAEDAFPDTLQALIAARLDTLTPGRKALLQNAAVIGRVFWSGAAAFLSRDEEDAVRADLHELVKKELVRRVPSSSFRDQAEYAFWHALVRDVAYGQIPRAERAEKHRKAAEWIESLAGERVSDMAEILAHHTISALELSEAAGIADGIDSLRSEAGRYLRLAAARTMSLDVGAAESQLRRAIELIPAGHPDRPQVEASLAEAAFHAGHLEESDRLYGEAIGGLQASGETAAAADAMARRSVVLEYRGETAAGRALLGEAVDLLERIPGPELARAMATRAGSLMRGARYREAVPEADRAIDLAEAAGESNAAARAHAFRGFARVALGDRGGIDEQRGSLRSLLGLGLGRAAAVCFNNLGSSLSLVEGPGPALEVLREGEAFSERRGLREMVMAIRNSMLTLLYETGEWDEVLRLGQEVVEEARRQGSGHDEVFAEADRALVMVHRAGSGARELCESVLARARPLEDPPMLLSALIAAGLARAAQGDHGGTVSLMREALDLTREEAVAERQSELALLVRLAVGAGDIPLGKSMLQGTETLGMELYRLTEATARATLAEAGGRADEAAGGYEELSQRWAQWGRPLEVGHALFGAGRCLSRLGREEQAGIRFAGAREVFETLGASPLMAEIDQRH